MLAYIPYMDPMGMAYVHHTSSLLPACSPWVPMGPHGSPWGQAAGYDDIVEILEHAEKADEAVFLWKCVY